MKITILCSAESHPVNQMLFEWVKNQPGIDVDIVRSKNDLTKGEILFLISCNDMIPKFYRENYNKTLVIHASDLPDGRGWSPHIWSIIEGNKLLTLSLLEAVDKVDSGDIWKKIEINIPKDALCDEINDILFAAESDLMTFAVEYFCELVPHKQETNGIIQAAYRRRTPEDSQLDPKKSIEAQFDLMRVCDYERFPAFFELHGCTYKIKLEKVKI